jgi:hypothetical protein
MFPRAAALAVVLLLVSAHAAVQKHQVVRIGFIPSATDATNNGAFQTRYSSQLAAFLAAVADMRSKYAATNITVEFAVRDAQSRFTSASRVLTNLATNAFQSTFPAHGVIGSDTTAVSSGIAYASNDFDMGQISFGSDAAFLGSGSMFPSFMRNFASNGYEAIAMYVPWSSTARPPSTLSLSLFIFYTTFCARLPAPSYGRIKQGGPLAQGLQVAEIRRVLLHRRVRHLCPPGPCTELFISSLFQPLKRQACDLWPTHGALPLSPPPPPPLPPLPPLLPSAAVEHPGRQAGAADHRDRAHHAGRGGDQLHQREGGCRIRRLRDVNHVILPSPTPPHTPKHTPRQLYAAVQGLAPLDARIWVLLSDDIPGVHNFWKVASPILSINTYFMGIR